jgi:hypothetical protein
MPAPGRYVARATSPIQVQFEFADRDVSRSVDVLERNCGRLEFAVEDRRTSDLCPIMILGIHPEDRDRADAVLAGGSFRELDGGDRLQQREQRTAEGARLLTRRDRDRCRIRESFRCGAGLGRSAAALLLGCHDAGNSRLATVRLDSADCVSPGVARRGIARVK